MTTKIVFRLDQDGDGFPPIAVETINASRLQEDFFKIENAPFFVENLSFHDIVEASPTEDATRYEFMRVVEKSCFTSLSIILLDRGMDAFLMEFFRGRNCVLEYGEFGPYRVLAVAIPSAVNYGAVRGELQRLEDQGLISFQSSPSPMLHIRNEKRRPKAPFPASRIRPDQLIRRSVNG